MEKTNDMFLNILANPLFAIRDFQAVGLNAENTQLLSEDKYKQSDKILSNPYFQDENGNFDENKFNQAYVNAAYAYNQLATTDYSKTILDDARFSEDNMWVRPEQRTKDSAPRLVKSPNTYLVSNSLTSLGKRGARTQSISEIAQTQLIYDTETGEWKDSPNDAFWDNYLNTLVLATYDEDEADEQGNIIHKKGDMKLNEDDLPYYETLGGRSVAGKQVLNKMNVLTTDGSFANKFDFFDSDGLEEKSWAGTILKNAALVGSMFIPYVGPAVAGLSVLQQSVGLVGTLGKLLGGSDNKVFNNMEGWAKTVNRSASTEYATQNTWCGENFLNMIGDTIGQLAEQRWLFKAAGSAVYGKDAWKAMSSKGNKELVAKYTKDLNAANASKYEGVLKELTEGQLDPKEATNLSKYIERLNFINSEKAVKRVEDLVSKSSKIGSPLSKAYMTAITVLDTYGEAKEAGASDLEAALLTLGYAAGEAAILNSEIGSWILPESRGDKFRAKAIANALTKDVKEAYNELAETQVKPDFIKKVLNAGKRLAHLDYAHMSGAVPATLTVMAHGLSEGFEEVSEEVLADVSKSIFNVTRWLRGEDGLDMGQWENMGDRYIMSALGGLIGGSITSAGTDFVSAKNLASMDKTQAMQELLYIVNNGKEKDFLKSIDSMSLGNKDLSATNIIGVTDGKTIYGLGTKEDNQDLEIKQLVHNQVGLLKQLLQSEGAQISTDGLINKLLMEDKQALNNMRFTGLRDSASLGLYLQDFQNIQSELVATKAAIMAIDRRVTDGQLLSQEDLDEKQLLNTKLQGLRVKKDAYIKGHTAGDFIRDAVFELNPILSDFAVKANLEKFAEHKYGRPYNQLTNSEKKLAEEAFKTYSQTDLKNDIHQQAAHFLDMIENATPVAQSFLEKIKAMGDQHKIVELVTKQQAHTLKMLASIAPDLDADSILSAMLDMINTNEAGAQAAMTTHLLSTAQLNLLGTILTRPLLGNTVEELAEDLRVRNAEYVQELQNMMLEQFDAVADPFIKLGYLHPETKKLVVDITNQLLKNAMAQMSLAYASGDVNLGRYFKDIYELLKQKKTDIQNLSNTPILKWISEYLAASTNSKINLDLHWQSTMDLFNNSQKNGGLDDFGITTDWEANQHEAEEVINSFEAVVNGMRVDNADFDNPTGYSKILNNVYRQSGIQNYTPLLEIDALDADLILEDVKMLKDRFAFAKNLNAINKGLKLKTLDRVGVNLNLLIFKNLLNFINSSGAWKNWKEVDKLQAALDSIQSDESYWNLDDKKLKLTKDEKRALEKELLDVQNAIYDFFDANKEANGRVNKDLLKSMISSFMDDSGYFELTGELMKETTEDMAKNTFIWWLAARGALKALDFNKAYRAGMNESIAPIPSQELSTYLGVASIVNMDFLNDFVDAYREAANEMFQGKSIDERKTLLQDSGIGSVYADKLSQYFAGNDVLPQYHNMIFIEGAPGTGKSGGVFTTIKSIIDNLDPEYLKDAAYVHATLSSADKAANERGFTGKTYGKTEFMKYISSDWKDARNNKLEFEYGGIKANRPVLYADSYEFVDGRLQNKWKLNKYTDAPKVLFVDELSHYNEQELSMVSQWAAEHQAVIIGAGDLSLDSNIAYAKINGEWSEVSNARNKFIRSLKLGVSLREHNAQMTKSNDSVQLAIEQRRKNKSLDLNINLTYYLDENGNHPGLYGVKTISNASNDFNQDLLNEIDKTILLMLNTRKDKNEKIGYIYHDTESKMYKHIMSKYSADIDPFFGSDAQGLEGLYYIVENNRDGNTTDEDTYLRSLYTGISRAELGVLAITPSDLGRITEISNYLDNAYLIETTSPEAIKREHDRKLALIDYLLENDSEPVNIQFKLPEKYTYTSAPTMTGPTTAPSPTSSSTSGSPSSSTSSSSSTSGTSNPTSSTSGTPTGFPPVVPPPPPFVPSRINFGWDDLARAQQEMDDFKLNLSGSGNLDDIRLTRTSDGKVFTLSNDQLIESDENGTTIYTPSFTLTSEDETFDEAVANINSQYTISTVTNTPIPSYNIGLKLTISGTTGNKDIIITGITMGPTVMYEVTNLDGSEPLTIAQDQLQSIFVKEYDEPIVEEEQIESTVTGLENEGEELRIAIEGAGLLPEKRMPKSGNFVHEFYSAMAFEMGVDRNDDGTIKFDGPLDKFDARIDNAIGLSKITGDNKYDSLEDELAFIKNELNSNDNNADILNILRRRLGLTGELKLDYALKTTAGRINSSDPLYDIYDQGDSETFKHSLMEDTTAHKLKIVAIVNQDGKNILEVTVATLDSPETLIQMENEDGTKKYAELYNIWNSALAAGKSKYKAMSEVYETYKDVDSYKDLTNRIKTYLYTSNGIIYLPKDFNVNKDMRPTAPVLTLNKGKWDDKHGVWKPQFIDLTEFRKLNKQLRTSSVLISKDGRINDLPVKGLSAGKAFVLVSLDNNLNTDAAIVQYFKNQIVDPNTYPPKVSLMYVLPPSEDAGTYVKNMHNIFTKNGGVKGLGNDFTPFRIVQALINNGKAEDIKSFFGDAETIQSLTDLVRNLEGIENKWDELTISFTDDVEETSYLERVRDFGEKNARRYMKNLEMYKLLYSDSEIPTLRKGTTNIQAFLDFLVLALASPSATTTEAERIDAINLAAVASGLNEIFYTPKFTDTVIDNTFYKVATDASGLNMINTVGGAPKAFQVSAKVDTVLYNTDALNNTFAMFADRVYLNKSTNTWVMDKYLKRRHEDRYLGIGSYSVKHGVSLSEQVKSTYLSYFNTGELNESLLDDSLTEELLLSVLINEYNEKAGNLGTIINGKLVLAKLPNSSWKLNTDAKYKLVSGDLSIGGTDTLHIIDSSTGTPKFMDIEVLNTRNADGTIKSLECRQCNYVPISNPVSTTSNTFNIDDVLFGELANSFNDIYNQISNPRKRRPLNEAFKIGGIYLRPLLLGDVSSFDASKSAYENFINNITEQINEDPEYLNNMIDNIINIPDIDGVNADSLNNLRELGQKLLNTSNGVGTFELNILDNVSYNDTIYEVTGISPDGSVVQLTNLSGTISVNKDDNLKKLDKKCTLLAINLI